MADARGDGVVGFASGAALVVRREAWDAAGGFDGSYFMYGEDLDLSLRLRLAGWEVGVAGGAVVEHDYEFAKGESKWFLLERNRWTTVLGVYPAALLLALLPALLAAEAAFFLAAARGGWLGAKARGFVGGPARAAGSAAAASGGAGVGDREPERVRIRPHRRPRLPVPRGRRPDPPAGIGAGDVLARS